MTLPLPPSAPLRPVARLDRRPWPTPRVFGLILAALAGLLLLPLRVLISIGTARRRRRRLRGWIDRSARDAAEDPHPRR